MLEERQDARTVAGRQRDTFVPSDNLLCRRQGAAQHEARQIQAFVRGGRREHPLLLTGGTQFNAIVTGG